MANNCFYQMQVTGKEDNLNTFVKWMTDRYPCHEKMPGRIFSCDEYGDREAYGEYISATLSGDCAWSIRSAMMERDFGIEQASRELSLALDIYSEELGMEFQEHIIIVCGDVIKNECVDYEEICLYDDLCENELGTYHPDNSQSYLKQKRDLYDNLSAKSSKELINLYDKTFGTNYASQNNVEFDEGYLRVGGFSEWEHMPIADIVHLLQEKTMTIEEYSMIPYLAYGSNLNQVQMKRRCKDAELIGTTMLSGYKLIFLGGIANAVASIVPEESSSVPIALYSVSKDDIKSLDIYEGFPRLYDRRILQVDFKGKPTKVFAYIMNDRPDIGIDVPSATYFRTILDGYLDLAFDKDILEDALVESITNSLDKHAL